MKKILPSLLVTILLSGCHSLQKKETLLTESGFHSVTATTAAQSAHLQSLPQGHLTPVTKGGQTLFFLADAKQGRLYIGNQSQYQAYQQLRVTKQLSRDQAAATDLDADASAEWNAWGGLSAPLWSPNF
jgi:hypothetical protein